MVPNKDTGKCAKIPVFICAGNVAPLANEEQNFRRRLEDPTERIVRRRETMEGYVDTVLKDKRVMGVRMLGPRHCSTHPRSYVTPSNLRCQRSPRTSPTRRYAQKGRPETGARAG
jgi:hypothetical protein